MPRGSGRGHPQAQRFEMTKRGSPMSADKPESPAQIWGARYDDRDDEELACQLWARSLASRDRALAQPFKNFPVADESADSANKPEPAADDAEHPR